MLFLTLIKNKNRTFAYESDIFKYNQLDYNIILHMEISMVVVKPHAFALKPMHNRPKQRKIAHKWKWNRSNNKAQNVKKHVENLKFNISTILFLKITGFSGILP